jgi:predicted lipoprotein with Yx(FWY)xxD motif
MRIDQLSPSESRRAISGRVAAACLALGILATTVAVSTISGALSSRATKGIVISTLKTAKLGTFLVSGKTLYTVTPKGAGCTAACSKYWFPLLLPKGVTKATAGPGVIAAMIGTMKRADGARQVTYAGKALYWFKLDTGPGKVTGNVTDTWGKWSDVVTVQPRSSKPPATTTTSKPPVTTTTSKQPVTTTTSRPPATTTTSRPPATTTTAPGGGGIGF